MDKYVRAIFFILVIIAGQILVISKRLPDSEFLSLQKENLRLQIEIMKLTKTTNKE